MSSGIASPDDHGRRPAHILAMMKYGVVAASTRQRLVQYAPYLRAHDIEIDLRPLLDDAYLRRFAQGRARSRTAIAAAYFRRFQQLLGRTDHDVIWVQYELFPYLPALFERLATLHHKPIIVDFDDAIFHMYDQHRLGVVRSLLGGKLTPLLSKAALCICGNEYLADYARRYCANVIVVPTVVDTDDYKPNVGETPESLAPIVGWIGSPSTWRYVEPLLPALMSAMAPYGARFRAVGAGPAARSIAGIEAAEWTQDTEVAEVQHFDIGIMPVPDAPWERGKCGYKLIQYMACGRPVIASPVGVNSQIVIDGENGFLARNPVEWASSVQRLLGDPAMRLAMGASGRARVDASYSLKSQEPRLLAALESVLGRVATQPTGVGATEAAVYSR